MSEQKLVRKWAWSDSRITANIFAMRLDLLLCAFWSLRNPQDPSIIGARRLASRLHLTNLKDPAHVFTFLGIEVDSTASKIRFPKTKLELTIGELEQRSQRRTCTKQELLSFIGILQHASMVVRPGRAFLRRMINLSKTAHSLHQRIRLNCSFCSDLLWWRMHIQR